MSSSSSTATPWFPFPSTLPKPQAPSRMATEESIEVPMEPQASNTSINMTGGVNKHNRGFRGFVPYDLESVWSEKEGKDFRSSTTMSPSDSMSSDGNDDSCDNDSKDDFSGRVYEKLEYVTQDRRKKRILILAVTIGFLILTVSVGVHLIQTASSHRTSSAATDTTAYQAQSPVVNETALPTAAPVASSFSFTAPPSSTPTSFLADSSPVSSPVSFPTSSPTLGPSASPVQSPVQSPTAAPVQSPTSAPVSPPTSAPVSPQEPTSQPTVNPTSTISFDYPTTVVIASNKHLAQGQVVSSPSGDYQVTLTSDGRFLLQDASSNTIWDAGVSGGYRVYMQSDGNMIVRTSSNKALWTSKTSGQRGAQLMVDDGGQIALYQGGTAIWLSGIPRGTYQGPPNEDLEFPVRGIFYYPWYPETWTVNGQLAHYIPDMGQYSSSDLETAENHVDALDYANIDVAIASWWGEDTKLDRARIGLLLETTVNMNSNLKWTVYHEEERTGKPSVDELREHFDYLKKWFAWHPAWAHIDGRPVIFAYNGGGCDVVDRWMEASNGEWYVVLKVFSKFDDCATQPDDWHQYGVNGGNPLEYDGYAYSIAPGFWRADEDEPSTERVSQSTWCANVESMANSHQPWQTIVSFNEAGEGTLVESSPSWASESGYGKYLDCLHEYPTFTKEMFLSRRRSLPVWMSWIRLFSTNNNVATALQTSLAAGASRIAVIGGGASGIFASIAASSHEHVQVSVLEATSTTLRKVKISGGGRCNVLHDTSKSVPTLLSGYPRGKRELKGLFYKRFTPTMAREWFEQQGVQLKTESDGRMFPTTDSSQTIIDTLLNAARRQGVDIQHKQKVTGIEHNQESFEVKFHDGSSQAFQAIIMATGSAPAGYALAQSLGQPLVSPVPSLFTLNAKQAIAPGGVLHELAGISVPHARVSLQKLFQEGPLLISHHGVTGPAVLKLSAFAAREFHAQKYQQTVHICWDVAFGNEAQVFQELWKQTTQHPKRTISNGCPLPQASIPRRLWASLVRMADLSEGQENGSDTSTPMVWRQAPKKNVRRLAQLLVRCPLEVTGKGTFKDEFVTAGGVSLKGIHMPTMESTHRPGLFFSGELIDVDGITGGYNFMNCWSTGCVAGNAAADFCTKSVSSKSANTS
eukprot:Nitzschia sp. Nitz4//scaffold89_size161592//120650//124604//NITZ4_002393-RA/size161592-processed-gene-0.20-mRNA-1//1//CDS//3329559661//2336//frame0